jgi:Big-like domain-containing protein
VARARRRFAAAAVATLAAGLIAVSGAHAGFAPATQVLSESFDSGTSHVSGAVDPAGNTIAVWDEVIGTGPLTVQVHGRWLSPGGALGPELPTLSGSDYAVNSDVAVAPNGRAFAAWQVQLGTNGSPPASIKGRWIEPDGSLGPILTLFTGSSGSHDGILPHVVMDPNGTATVVWEDETPAQVGLRRVAPDGTLGPQLTPPLADQHWAAALPNGATFLVGGTSGDDTVTVAANGSFPGSATQISTSAGSSTLQPGIAFDSHGDGLVVWRKTDFSGTWWVMARRIDSSGTPFGPELTVEGPTGNSLSTDFDPGVDSSGHFLVGWFEQDSGNDGHAFVRAVNLDGSFAGPRQQVSDAGGVSGPHLGLDDRGTGIAAFDFSPPMSLDSVAQARLLGVDATPIGAVTPLGGPRTSDTTVASDPPSGAATILSELRTGDQYTVVARRFLEPPTCADANATVVQGRPVVVALSCAGVALTGAQAVTQPAHGTLAPVAGQPFSLQYTPTPGYQGSDSFLFQGSNDGGASPNATVHIAVGKDTVRPRITRLRLRRSRSAGLSADLAKRKAARVFYSFQLALSEPSSVKVQIQRPIRGVRKGKRCTVRRHGSRGRPCTLYRRVVLLSSRKLATSANLRVSTKQLAKLVKLGKLRASAVATDAAGNHSKPRLLKKVRFRR